jgi:hypothetical protein
MEGLCGVADLLNPCSHLYSTLLGYQLLLLARVEVICRFGRALLQSICCSITYSSVLDCFQTQGTENKNMRRVA